MFGIFLLYFRGCIITPYITPTWFWGPTKTANTEIRRCRRAGWECRSPLSFWPRFRRWLVAAKIGVQKGRSLIRFWIISKWVFPKIGVGKPYYIKWMLWGGFHPTIFGSTQNDIQKKTPFCCQGNRGRIEFKSRLKCQRLSPEAGEFWTSLLTGRFFPIDGFLGWKNLLGEIVCCLRYFWSKCKKHQKKRWKCQWYV